MLMLTVKNKRAPFYLKPKIIYTDNNIIRGLSNIMCFKRKIIQVKKKSARTYATNYKFNNEIKQKTTK